MCPLWNNAGTCVCWVFAFLSYRSLDQEIFLRTTQSHRNQTLLRCVAQVGVGPGVTGTEKSQSSMIRTEAVPGSFLALHAPPLVWKSPETSPLENSLLSSTGNWGTEKLGCMQLEDPSLWILLIVPWPWSRCTNQNNCLIMSKITTMICQEWTFQGYSAFHLNWCIFVLFPFKNSVTLSLDTKIFFGGSSLLLGVAINGKELELLIGLIYLIGVLFFLFCFCLILFLEIASLYAITAILELNLFWCEAQLASSSAICLCLPSNISVVFT